MSIYNRNPNEAIAYLTDYSNSLGADFLTRWQKLAYHLIVKFNDMAEKPDINGEFQRSKYGLGATVKRSGYPARTAKRLIESTGDKFLIPEK